MTDQNDDVVTALDREIARQGHTARLFGVIALAMIALFSAKVVGLF